MLFCLICVNMVAILAGGGMLGFGAWLFSIGTSPFELLSAMDQSLKAGISIEVLADVDSRQGVLRKIALLLVIIGTIAMTVAFLGIVAVIQKSSIFAILYKVAVISLLASHAAATIYVITKRPDLDYEIQLTMHSNQDNNFIARTRYFNASKIKLKTVTTFYERMHISLSCCGVMSLYDVKTSSSFKRSIERDPSYNALVPYSCCELSNPKEALRGEVMKLIDSNCPFVQESSTMHREPCYPAVYRVLRKIVMPAVAVCGAFSLVLAAALGMMAAEMCVGIQVSSSDSFVEENEDEVVDSD